MLGELRRAANPADELVQVGDGVPYTAAAGAEAAFMMSAGAPFIRGLLDAVPTIRWLALSTAGAEQYVAEGLAARPGLTLTSNPAQGEAVAEYTMALIYVAAKNLHQYAWAQRQGTWAGSAPWRSGNLDVAGSTLLIYGLGAIGTRLAEIAAGNRMRVLGIRRTGGPPAPGVESVHAPDRLADLAAEADFLALTAPLTPATRGAINAAVLARMKPTAWIVNVARGPLIDEPALIAALQDHRIGGAAMDTFDREPLPPAHPYWSLENVIITPHTGGSSSPDRGSRAAGAWAENLRRFKSGEPLRRVVSPEAGY